MTIDISKIRPGDEVTVRVKVSGPRGGGWAIHPLQSPADSFVLGNAIVSHTPKELQPGDRVKSRFDGAEYEIVAGPRQRKDGVIEVALWSDELGFLDARTEHLERV